MGFDDTFKQMLELGPSGIMTRPDTLFEMLLCLCSRQEEAGRNLKQMEMVLSGQNEQLNNAKRAINLVYKQQGRTLDTETPPPPPPAIEDTEVKDRLDRLDRMHDITSERVSVNQELVTKLQSSIESIGTAKNNRFLKFESKITELNSLVAHHKQVLTQLENKVRKLDETPAPPPLLTENCSYEKPLKTLEKKLVTAITEVAERTDTHKSNEEGVLHARMREMEKAMSTRVKQIDAMYDLWEVSKQDAQWGVEGTPDDRIKVLHATPSFAGLIMAVSRLGKAQQQQQQQQQQQIQVQPAPQIVEAPQPSLPPATTIIRQQVQEDQGAGQGQGQGKAYPVVGLEIVDGPGPSTGVRVVSVLPSSPAQQAGIAPGDRLLTFNEHPTDTRAAFMAAALQSLPNSTVTLQRITPSSSKVQLVSLVLGSSTVSPAAAQQLRAASKRSLQPQHEPTPWR